MGTNNTSDLGTDSREERKESHRDRDDDVITYIGDVPVTNEFIDIIRGNGA